MQVSDPHVTAHIVRTEDGEIFHEYEGEGVAYGSLGALESALEHC